MHKNHDKLVSPRLFYAFVDFQPEHPRTYIIPSKIVADVIARAHRIWLETPGNHGRLHKDSDMRRLVPEYKNTEMDVESHLGRWIDRYAERWDLLLNAIE